MSLNSPSDSSSYRPRIGTIIVPTDPYWVQTLEAVIHTVDKIGDELVMLQPAATLEEELTIPTEDLVDQILAHSLDALICTVTTAPFVQDLVDAGLPIICLSEFDFHHPYFTSAASLYQGGRIAGRYIGQKLNGRGHAVCVTAGLENIPATGQSRLEGFRDGLKDFQEVTTAEVKAYWTYAQAYPALLKGLKDYPQRIDAIFGVSDAIILAAREAGRKLGVIDDHTVLVGLNGDPVALAAIAEGELAATIDTSSELLGADAAKIAHQAALGLGQPDIINQRYKLITRENVASIATRKLTAIADIPNRMVGYSRQQERARLSQLEVSMEITRQIGSLLDRNRLIQIISELVHRNFGYDWMRILRWSESEKKLVHYEGELSPASQQAPIERDWLLHQVYLSNEAVVIPDTRTSRRWHTGKEWEAIRSRAVLPIHLGEKVIGVLDLQSSQPVRQPSLEVVGLKLLASQLGIAIQNTDLYLDALQAREVAERANQLKTRLVANVGHEMRTPLNAILGFSQSIQKKIGSGSILDPEELEQDIGHIYRSGEHLMYMINDLLDLSRAEIGALSLYFEPLQPAPFLRELFENFADSKTDMSEVHWSLDIPERLPVIRADVVRLRQVLINLLSNAVKYTRRGTILLGAAVELPFLHLWVEDTGEGVPLDIQEKIFEPFALTGKKRRTEGIGLGLSISRHLVGLHDGLITLESQPGKGSTFHIYLPLPGVTRETPRTETPGGLSILLVVSSQPDIPDEIMRICEGQNLTPRIVSTREDLNKAIADGNPKVIAWDLAHANSNEWNLLYRISANQKCEAVPIILYGVEENGGQLAAGLTNIVFKPNNGNAIKDWIDQVYYDIEGENPILVVDDDPQAREYYRNLLKISYPQSQVLMAENGSRALDILRTEVPALILLDLMMPEVDGFGVLERVRSDVRTQRVPVVIISGKLLNYEDIQRLNYYKTVFYTKGILTDQETAGFLVQIDGENRPLPQPTSMLIKQGLAFLHQNYTQPVTRKAIADSVGVSENYLSQIFRQEMTISPWDYLNRLRIQKARELLLNTQDSVTKIGTAVGFNDSAYFSRVFHKVTGQSPQEFRQSR